MLCSVAGPVCGEDFVEVLSILHWRCRARCTAPSAPRRRASFNTPLEMPGDILVVVTLRNPPRFQYSIGDAEVSATGIYNLRVVHFQYSIGDAATTVAKAPVYTAMSFFQYSIGDAAIFVASEDRQKDVELSILHWRCPADMHIAYNIGLPPGDFQYSIGDASGSQRWPLRIRARLSILHWRCLIQHPYAHLRRNGAIFQYSIGDAKIMAITFLLARVYLSILHWRCWGFLCLVFVGF